MNTTAELKTKNTLNQIGLDGEYTAHLGERLNDLLANYQVFYQNVRGFHWNIKGEKFFELHVKFEELYTDLHEKIDELAERVLTLGAEPLHTFSDYLGKSEIAEKKRISDAHATVQNVVHSLQALIKKQRELLTLSAEANDEGTNALMSDYTREYEKLVWMYNAFLR